MRYRIEYADGRCCNFANSRKDLLDWLKLLKDEKIVDIRKIYISLLFTGFTRIRIYLSKTQIHLFRTPLTEITPVVGFSGCWLFFFSSMQSPNH